MADAVSDKGEWIYASEALQMITTASRSERKAKNILTRYLVEGKIRARCSQLISEVDFNKLSRTLPREGGARQVKHIGKGGNLTHQFWLSPLKTRMDRTLWKWDANVCGRVSKKAKLTKNKRNGRALVEPGERCVAYGVTFFFADIKMVINESFSGRWLIVRKDDVSRLSGRNDPRWNIIDDLEEAARQGRLSLIFGPTNSRGWQARMIKIVQERVDDPDGWPSIPTIKRKLVQLHEINEIALQNINGSSPGS